MSLLETLEARRDARENEMYALAVPLSRRLHLIDERIGELRAEIHRLIAECPRIAIEEKTIAVVEQIRRLGVLELREAIGEARAIAELKAEIDALERRIEGVLSAEAGHLHRTSAA